MGDAMTDRAIGEAAGALLRAGVPLVVDAIGDAIARANDPAVRLASIQGDIIEYWRGVSWASVRPSHLLVSVKSSVSGAIPAGAGWSDAAYSAAASIHQRSATMATQE